MTKKRLLIVVAVLFLFLFVAWRWIARTPSEADDQSHAAKSEGAIPAAFVRVERGSLEDTLTISGAFKPFQNVDVHAKGAGYIRKIFVDGGDHVREGQTLAELEAYAGISAPFAGVITNRFADTGTLVAAGTSSSTQAIPVVRLAQVSKLRLVLAIPESAAGQIRLGDAVKVHVDALQRDFEGKVARFAAALDQQTRTMETELDFENGDGRLLPGMYTETKLVLRGKKNVLAVPLEAVSRNGSEETVLAL